MDDKNFVPFPMMLSVIDKFTEAGVKFDRIPVAIILHPDDYDKYSDEYVEYSGKRDSGALMLIGPRGERVDVMASGRVWNRYGAHVSPGVMTVAFFDGFDAAGNPQFSNHYVTLYEPKPSLTDVAMRAWDEAKRDKANR